MNVFPGAGVIEIRVATARDVVCSAEIQSSRPVGLARVFVGREPSEAALLARRLFSLCGCAQAAAASEAVTWARGRKMSEGDRFAATIGVLAERAFEGLRALVLGWPGAEAFGAAVGRSGPKLREAAVASQILAAAGASGLGRRSRDDLLAPLARLAEAARALGLGDLDGSPPRADSLLGAIDKQCERERCFVDAAPDGLTPEDDVAVITALARDPEAFVGAPRLPGRLIETGAFARLWRRTSGSSALAARLSARLLDIARALASLERSLRLGELAEEDAPSGGAVGQRAGFGAVECARGRLHHLVQITSDGRIGDYRILAPTEWNFHASGPYIGAILGARLASGANGRLSLARLAALFDPCVGFEVSVKEHAGA